MVGPAIGKARQPTVGPIDSFTDGTSRRLVRPSRAEGTSTRQIGDTNQLVDQSLFSGSMAHREKNRNTQGDGDVILFHVYAS